MNSGILKSQKLPYELTIKYEYDKIIKLTAPKLLFLMLITFLKKCIFSVDQPMCMCSHKSPVSIGTGASNGSCSDAMTLLIGDWLFYRGGGTIPPYWALHFLHFISNWSAPSLVYLKSLTIITLSNSVATTFSHSNHSEHLSNCIITPWQPLKTL